MSATSIAIMAATTSTAYNNAAASAAKKEACKLSVNGYQHSGASVAQMRSYAECIQILHPHKNPPSMGWTILALVAVVLFSALVGAIRGAREREIVTTAFYYGVAAFIFIFFGGVFVALIGYALSLI